MYLLASAGGFAARVTGNDPKKIAPVKMTAHRSSQRVPSAPILILLLGWRATPIARAVSQAHVRNSYTARRNRSQRMAGDQFPNRLAGPRPFDSLALTEGEQLLYIHKCVHLGRWEGCQESHKAWRLFRGSGHHFWRSRRARVGRPGTFPPREPFQKIGHFQPGQDSHFGLFLSEDERWPRNTTYHHRAPREPERA